MNSNSKRLGIYLTVMLLATSVATALRTVACIRHLDFESGFFTDKSLSTVADIITLLTVLGMFSYAFAASRIKLRASFSTGATYVPTGLLGVATVFLGAATLTHALTSGKYPFLHPATLSNPSAIVGVLAAVLAFASVGYHFLNAFVTEAKSNLRTYFASAAIAFLAFYAMLIYLDGTRSINETAKILRQTAFLLCALFFLYEERISLGREMWRVYSAFGLAAASLTAYTSVPAIITYYVKGKLISSSGNASLASIEEYVFLLAAFIFILSRLILTARLPEDKENELIKTLSDYAEEQEKKTRESEERHKELFASKQLSIFDLYGGDFAPAEEENEEQGEEISEEEEKEPTISDDAIYEAIFGKMPDRPEEDSDNAEESTESIDEREPEEVADDILNAVDEAMNEGLNKGKKEK